MLSEQLNDAFSEGTVATVLVAGSVTREITDPENALTQIKMIAQELNYGRYRVFVNGDEVYSPQGLHVGAGDRVEIIKDDKAA